MNRVEASVEALQRLRFPAEPSVVRDGKAVVATVRPATREANQSYQSRIWSFTLDGTAQQLTDGPGTDDLPRPSSVDDRMAFASDRDLPGKMAIYLRDGGGEERRLAELAGTVEDIRWSRDGAAIFALAADRGLEGGATNGAQRLTWGDPDDPIVTNPTDAKRRIIRVDPVDGSASEVGPRDLSVWEFDLVGTNAAVALASADASERGWHHSELILIDFVTREIEVLHRAEWPMQALAVDSGGKRVAFVENWSSDRGLVSGEISLLDIATREISRFAPGGVSNVTSMSWRDDASLWFAGWAGLGSVYGVTGLDGTVEWMTREDATIGASTFTAAIVPAPDKEGIVAIRQADGLPPEMHVKTTSAVDWTPISALNRQVADGFPGYPEIRAVSWKGEGGLGLEGLVLLPRQRSDGPQPTIVSIHGGPSWASKHAFDPGHALPLVAAGYVVFLPNYRGNVGWGKEFGLLNIGDPAGAEFADILAGVDWCVGEGLADNDRLGVTGASYGGYLTAWAVATTDRFKAAVMVSGIANQLSSHYSCSHDFHGFINGGPLTDPANRQVALDRSPIMRLAKPTTPTLIVHGDGDRCTPLGQAREFYTALLAHGATAELVVYPREGHGLQERGHQIDSWRRTVDWFDRYLRSRQ